MKWAAFFAAILPALTDLARELYRRHGGDSAAARSELRAIRDHWAKLEAAEKAIDARLEAVKKREGSS